MDLGDLLRGRLSLRRLASLVVGMPPDCATARSVAGDAALWGLNEYLLAAAVDALAGANWQRGGSKGHKPKRVPRPGMEDDTTRYGRTEATPEQVRAFLDQFRPVPADADEGDDDS